MSDHLCFLFKEETIKNDSKSEKYSIFTGDHIVGATSTYFEDYPDYFESLLKTQKIISENEIEHMYVAHSMTLRNKDIGVPAAAKNQQYITRRRNRDRFLEANALKIVLLPEQNNKFTIDEFYDFQMKKKEDKAIN